ncbi:calcium-binding protein [Dactylosporangium sp. NPDC006015]|uniref:calcium-binding protein n=1 Tax=Dactylosporangium sp. NPDC006015 TaxID=3154576 RepID=UPI0033A6B0B4
MMRRLAALTVAATMSTVLVTVEPAAAVPPGGSAGTDISHNLTFSGAPGFANDVVVTKSGTTVTIDDTYPISVSGDCTHPVPGDDTVAQCTVSMSPDIHVEPGDWSDRVTVIGGGSVHWLIGTGDGNDTIDLTGVTVSGSNVAAGNGNDTVTSSTHGEQIDGGAGADTVSYAQHPGPVTVDLSTGDGGPEHDGLAAVEAVVGGPGDDTLTGDAGANTLSGGDGDDLISGGGGNDTLLGGDGADTMYGGTGVDTVSYGDHAVPVTASLDGLANDGAPGEGDLIGSAVENLTGGSADDVLYGNDSANVLRGDPSGNWLPITGGADTIYPLGGNDVSYGLGGDDTITDGDGADTIYGGYGADDLHGGAGGDTIHGDQGADTLSGGSGYDALDGGADIDWCHADTGGASKTACEFPGQLP